MSPPPTGEQRATVIERAINIEWLMALVICQHYLREIAWPFFVEVLYDEAFTFGLKVSIILKVCKPTSQQEEDLRRVGRIRNRFAHLATRVARSATAEPLGWFAPDPRKPDQAVNFEADYDEFQVRAGRVEEFLAQALASRGYQLTPDPPSPA